MGENEQDYKDKMLELIQLEYNAMREEINSAHSHIYTTDYSRAAEPPVRCGESHLSGLTEPPSLSIF